MQYENQLIRLDLSANEPMILVDSISTTLPTNAAYRSFLTVCTFQKLSVVTQLCEITPLPKNGNKRRELETRRIKPHSRRSTGNTIRDR